MTKAVLSSKSRVAAISVAASATMAAVKFLVGIAIGSLALISEALHSSIDLVATIITWVVVRISDRPADDEHHYGHGKIESLSALGVIALLYILAGGVLVTAYGHLREGAGLAADDVVGLPQTVDGESDAVETSLDDFLGNRLVDQRALRHDVYVDPARLGVSHDLQDVRTKERLAPQETDPADPQVVDQLIYEGAELVGL